MTSHCDKDNQHGWIPTSTIISPLLEGEQGIGSTQSILEDEGQQVVEGKVDWRGRPARKGVHGGLFPSFLIQVIYGLDCFSSIALAMNLVTYFTGVMHFDLADASNMVTNFLGTSYILAVVVACFADTFIGRCRAVLISTCIEFLGFVLLTVQAHFPTLKPRTCNVYTDASHCKKVEGLNAALLYCSLCLIAVGMAGVKAGLPSHGADQFDDNDLREARQMSSFFNWLMLSSSIGSAVSLTLVVWVQTSVGWDWGFGLSAIGVLFETLIFAVGIPRYRMQAGGGTNPVIEIIQVFVASIRKRNLKLPKNPKELYEIYPNKESTMKVEFTPHRDMFRFMDKAAIQTTSRLPGPFSHGGPSPWKLCRVTQVEHAKTILGMIPIFCSSIIMSTCLAQIQTFTIQQGLTMDNRLGSLHVPTASLSLLPLACMIVSIPIYDRFLVPSLRRLTGHPTGITHLQRVGVGLLLSSLSMAIAAVVEVARKRTAESYHMMDVEPVLQPLPISMFWLSLQSFVFGMSDMFTYVGLLEFFYSEAPRALKSIATSFLWCSIAMGYFVSTILVEMVNWATRGVTESRGWLAGNNLNRNHLDLFYWLLAALTFINFLNYLYWASRYEYNRVQQEPKMASNGEEKALIS